MINFLIGFLIEIKVLALKKKIDKASHVLSKAMLSKGMAKTLMTNVKQSEKSF
ncbi:hypothetical protein [Klebsiella pneumoniae]|uniref:hypothetical protein n=1 Tax=Klebsiella pneumoniae TaxID=573 RepID=UPI001BD0872B|nr:hypothetical protein [Klebsiella pneumoniae]MBS4517656.1 hypothetical protein [Klebsiella pneumoniae]